VIILLKMNSFVVIHARLSEMENAKIKYENGRAHFLRTPLFSILRFPF